MPDVGALGCLRQPVSSVKHQKAQGVLSVENLGLLMTSAVRGVNIGIDTCTNEQCFCVRRLFQYRKGDSC
jgi:hypothetical protein